MEPTGDTPPEASATVDRFIPPGDLAVRLPVFEGPLDLLLFLIRRNEIDIYDIPIETVLKQYLAVLRGMERLSLEVAGDFFVLAATLMVIKSRMLLPREQDKEEDETDEQADPRWELVQQLLEYRRFKEAAERLQELALENARHVPRLVRESDGRVPRPLAGTDKIELWNVFNLVLRRLAEKIVVGDINEESITVSEQMEALLGVLRERPSLRFTEFVGDPPRSLAVLIASFLAVLELTRLGHIDLAQAEPFGDIAIMRREPPAPGPVAEVEAPADPSERPDEEG